MTNRRRRPLILFSGTLFGVLVLFNSCQSRLFEPSHAGTSTTGNPLTVTAFAVSEYQQITSLSICLSQMVLMNVSGGEVTVPFPNPTMQVIPVGGTDLWTLPVPSGQYTKINLVLANACGSGQSLSLTNTQGTFNTSSSVALEFSGNEFVGASAQKVVFDFQTLATALSQAQSNSNVANLAMTAQGLYHSSNCGMQTSTSQVAFCDTFDQSSPAVSRSGQIDSSTWFVSRFGSSNQGQGMYDSWNTSTIDACGTLQPAQPDGSDVIVCNGQMRESVNDANMGATALTLSPRQPFDFAGRTGTVAFDVTNDTTGGSGVWPEFWLTDQSLPAPQSFNGLMSIPKNGVAIRLNGNFAPNQGGMAPGCPNDGNNRWVVGSVSIIQNYVTQNINWFDGNPAFQSLGCVIASDGSNGRMNHIEMHVSQNQIQIWATDAGSPHLIEIAVINPSLPFTRGYVSVGDYHNNTGQSHTFAWDNFSFDGPAVPSDLGFDVLDALTSIPQGFLNLGWEADPGTPANLSTVALTASNVTAANGTGLGATLTFNFSVWSAPVSTINYTVNGTPLSATVPFTAAAYQNYSVSLPVPATALVAGPQTISISGDGIFILYNVDINLPGAGP